MCSSAGGVTSLLESCVRLRAQLILPILRCGVGLARAHSLLRVCGGGVWRPLSSASGRGQGRLGLGGLSRQTTTFYLPSSIEFSNDAHFQTAYIHRFLHVRTGTGRGTKFALKLQTRVRVHAAARACARAMRPRARCWTAPRELEGDPGSRGGLL